MAQKQPNNKELTKHLASWAILAHMHEQPRWQFPLFDLHWIWFAGGATLLIIAGGVSLVAYQGSFALGQVTLGSQPYHTNVADTVTAKQVTSAAEQYQFKLTTPGGQPATYKLADAGITVDGAASAAEARQSVRDLSWERFAWWHKTQVPLIVVKSNAKFKQFVATKIATANQAPKDATLSVSTGKAVITEATPGWQYTVPGGNQAIVMAATTMKPLNVTLAKGTVAPSITNDNLITSKLKIDKLLDHKVTFTLDNKPYTPTAKDVAAWLDIDPVPAKKTVDVTVNSGKIQAWLDKATKSVVQPPRSEVTTTDDAGNKTVLTPGQNGMTITNEAAAVKSVADKLQQPGTDVSADLAVAYKSYGTINAADYDKWIVADVTTKRMYAYEHSTLVRSFLVSAGAPKTPTVLGTYKIYSKYVSKDMTGKNADGSRYRQPHVHYVNFFYQDYAIHGNYWRPASYFGNINSSHGCVGITDSDAEWLYNWAPIGTTVITHS